MTAPFPGWVLDAPVIVKYAAGDLYAQAAVWLSAKHDATLVLPALALSAALPRIPAEKPEAMAALAVLMGLAEVDEVTTSRAFALADVRARADNPAELAHDPDLLAVAHVVSVAADLDWPIITDGVARIHALDPTREVKLIGPRRPPRF